MRTVFAAATLAVAAAQDPAQGWLGYATAKCPEGTEVTSISAYWKVGATPEKSNSFYSPWFGIDTSDNLNLLQPVNPWLGDGWLIYNEYYQWVPSYNYNSNQHAVAAGDQLFGSITLKAGPSYDIYHNVSGSTSWQVTSNIKNQVGKDGKPKKFTIAYFVYEKVAPCAAYPPDGKVTFENINLECSGKKVTPEWTTAYVEDVCNNRAHIVNSDTIDITWDTKASDPSPALIAQSQADKKFGRKQ